MKHFGYSILWITILTLLPCKIFAKGISVKRITCQETENPLGLHEMSPRLAWKLTSNEECQFQTAYRILVSSSKKNLNNNIGDIWDTKKVSSSASIQIPYQGTKMISQHKYYWKVMAWDKNDLASSWSKAGFWSMGLLNQTDWKAKWIGLDKAMENDKPNIEKRHLSARYLRKEFINDNKIKRATAYICGQGFFEVYINGSKIGDQVLAPALSTYNKRSYYLTLDVTENVKKGNNAIGVILGSGRFFAPRKKEPTLTKDYGFPKVIAQVELEFENGAKKTIISDTDWKVTANGPIISNNEYDGEKYDATKEINGWDEFGYNDSDWMVAKQVDPASLFLDSYIGQPIKVTETIEPKSVKEIAPGKFIFDMGQNIAGWCRLKVKGPKNTEVKLRFAEILKNDGTLYTANLRSAAATDTYILKGSGTEVYEPRFTYHGFRFVEVSGFPGTPDLKSIEGRVVNDDLSNVGSFETSNTLINQIYKNTRWGLRGNYKSIPMDCPQRDERQGWLGDRVETVKGETFMFNTERFYLKWLQDIEDSQRENGNIVDVCPDFWTMNSKTVTFPVAFMNIANILHTQYGNPKAITKHYNAFKKWMVYMNSNLVKDGIVERHVYGDWCMPPEKLNLIHTQDPTRKTNGQALNTAYYYYVLTVMQKFATLTKNENDRIEFATLAEKIKAAYNSRFYKQEQTGYDNNTVTINLLSLAFGLVPEGEEQKLFNKVCDKIEKDFSNHICTGQIGAKWIMRTLTKYGRPDLAFSITTKTDYPSWGYMIENGATTIWELWNGNTADPAMNSGNHVMLVGDLMIWLHENVSGLKTSTESVGYKEFLVNPLYNLGLDFVNVSLSTPYGTIKNNWKIEDNNLLLDVTVPVNTTATIALPNLDRTLLKNQIAKIKGIKFEQVQKTNTGWKINNVGSGTFIFKGTINN